MFKGYTNPLYDVVEDEEAWLNGLCAIFANALAERYGLALRALVVRSVDDPTCKTLVHAFGLAPDGRFVDSRGMLTEAELRAHYEGYEQAEWRLIHCAKPGEAIELAIEPVTVEVLWALSPEDLDATNAAHAHIEAHPERFASLVALEQA